MSGTACLVPAVLLLIKDGDFTGGSGADWIRPA